MYKKSAEANQMPGLTPPRRGCPARPLSAQNSRPNMNSAVGTFVTSFLGLKLAFEVGCNGL